MSQPPDKPADSPQTATEFHTPEPTFTPSREESQFKDNDMDVMRAEQDFREPELASDLDVGAAHEELARESISRQPVGFVAVPFSLLALFGFVVLWAGVYLGTYSGGFSGKVFTEKPGAGGKGGPVAPPDPVKIGEKLFNANCAQCHQQTGLGVAGQFPPLVGSEWVVGPAPNRLTHILLHGVQGPIKVKGESYNNQMPAWNTLKDEQIAAILTYIRQAWGNSAPPITKESIALARKETETHTEAYTEAELLKIPEGPLQGGEAAAGPPAQKAGPPAGTTQTTAPAAGNPPPDVKKP